MKMLSFWLGLLLLIPGLQISSLPLVILVRDGAGNPMAGVPLEILVEGPPHEPYDTCVTDGDGRCRLVIPPGAYIIRFVQGWRGLEFVAPEGQNAGALDDGTTGGGFGVYFEPSEEEQVVTFVIGIQDGLLIPLWDMSRNPQAPPVPFALPISPLDNPNEALASIDLSALVVTPPAETPTVESEAQIITSEVEVGVGTTATPSGSEPTPVPTSGPAETQNAGKEAILLGLAGLGGLLVLLIGGTLLAHRLRLRRLAKGR